MADPFEAKARKQAATLLRWSRMVSASVKRSVDLAHAHATVALTDTLQRTPDGRKTLRRARQSKSYQASCNRLDELHDKLTGPNTASMFGLIRDARSEFYQEAFTLWRALYPAEFAVAGSPSAKRFGEMRSLVLHGTELRTEIGSIVDATKRTLLATIERAARKSSPDHVATDLLDGWKRSAFANLNRSATVALSDSQVAIDSIAGVDAVKPEYRRDNEYEPS